jgi:hypothetical protein
MLPAQQRATPPSVRVGHAGRLQPCCAARRTLAARPDAQQGPAATRLLHAHVRVRPQAVLAHHWKLRALPAILFGIAQQTVSHGEPSRAAAARKPLRTGPGGGRLFTSRPKKPAARCTDRHKRSPLSGRAPRLDTSGRCGARPQVRSRGLLIGDACAIVPQPSAARTLRAIFQACTRRARALAAGIRSRAPVGARVKPGGSRDTPGQRQSRRASQAPR